MCPEYFVSITNQPTKSTGIRVKAAYSGDVSFVWNYLGLVTCIPKHSFCCAELSVP